MRSFIFFVSLFAVTASSYAKPIHESAPSNNRPASNPEEPCSAQGEPLYCYSPAYNAPAAVNLNRKNWKYYPSNITGFLDLSFIYWYAGEEGLSLATNGVLSSGVEYLAKNTTTLFQSSDYKPGFKIGAGIVGNHSWTLSAEYTWFRATHLTDSGPPLSSTVQTAGTAAVTSGTEVWIVNDWFLQGTPSQALSGSSISSKWHLAMDLIDLVAGRPFYQGTHLVVSPFGGLRAALIRQSMTVNLHESSGLFSGVLPPQPIQSRNHSNSWAIGPRGGCDVHYLLPRGFRLEGDCALSLFYTQYTSVKHSEDIASNSYNRGPYTASYSDYSALRPELDLGLGLGWGRYLHNREYHIDFSANYDFMIFWEQNMMRKLLDDALRGTGSSAPELYLHGVTLTGSFDF